MPALDVIVPVYNEAAGLAGFHAQLYGVLEGCTGYSCRIVYVDDGSNDGSETVLAGLASESPRVTVLRLARNFGHQAALTAGLDMSDGDAVIMLDGDGEHPVKLIPEMLRLYELGYDLVQTRRIDAGSDGFWLKNVTSRMFYGMINRIGETRVEPGTADFRLLSRRMAEAVRGMREYHRFFRGMVPWVGMRSILLPYHRGKRLSGNTKYSFRKMLRLAGDGMFSFSLAPLRLSIALGVLFLMVGGLETAYIASFWLMGKSDVLVPGWSSTILLVTLGSGVSMILQGIMGIYIGMIFQEVKRRPIYVVRERVNAAVPDPPPQ